MRTLLGILIFLSLFGPACAENGEFEAALQIANAGANELALRRIDQWQPSTTDARWVEWETLRFDLLVRLDRHQLTLQRAAILPNAAPEALQRRVFRQAAQAAMAIGDGKRARDDYLVRLLWQFENTVEELRALRLQVIDSYLAERNAGEAYRAMLRYQQDYQPLDKTEATHFVEVLLAQGLVQEAVNWLAQLDENGALKPMLRLQAGLLAPDAVVGAARDGWRQTGDVAFAAAMLQAATALNDATLRIEALEHQANAKGAEFSAEELWKAYLDAAPAIANRYRLLSGDDAGWLEAAERAPADQAPGARALLAYLALHAQAMTLRVAARHSLISSLAAERQHLAAVRLFADNPAQILSLLGEPEQVEALMLLGLLAERKGDYFSAADYYLRAAGNRSDAAARSARLAAAESLLQAGYLRDAQAQYDWLITTASQPKAKPRKH